MVRIEIINVSKKYESNVLFKNLNMQLLSGTQYCIIGSNASGKSVLLKMLSGIIIPDSGVITITSSKQNPSIGALIESPNFIQHLSGFSNLQLLANFRRRIKKSAIINTMINIGLDPYSKIPYSKYSLGMKQKLGIAQAIMESPDILLLDEPINSLDSQGANTILNLINDYSKNNLVVTTAHQCDKDYSGIICKIHNHIIELEDAK